MQLNWIQHAGKRWDARSPVFSDALGAITFVTVEHNNMDPSLLL